MSSLGQTRSSWALSRHVRLAAVSSLALASRQVADVPQAVIRCRPTRLSFDHLVSLGKQRGRHGEAERIRGPAIYDEFELGRLLDREVGGLGPLQDLVHESGSAPVEDDEARAVGHQAPIVRELAKAIHGREAAAGSQGHDPGSMRKSEGVIEGDEGLSVASRGSGERRLEALGSADLKRLKG